MKKLTSLFIIIMITSHAIAQDKEKVTLTMGPFYSLKIYSKLHVNLIYSDVNKAVAYGDNAHDVIVSLNNNTLKIKLTTSSILDLGTTYVDLYHSNPLDQIIAHQGVKLTSDKIIEQTSIKIESKGGSEIDFKVKTDRLDGVVNTGGKIFLRGHTTNYDLTINTGGICESEEMMTEQAKIKIVAGGFAYINVSQLLDASITGGGVLRVYGNPIKQITETKLGGKIYFHD